MSEELRDLTAGNLRLCIRDRGQGPAVVLLHGTTANLGVWDEVVHLLGDDKRTVAVDQRGHGCSDKPAAGYSAQEYTSDVAELIQALDCGPAVVVGHSLGARNAVVLGAQHPELVVGVVAVDYTPFVSGKVLDELQVRVAGGDRSFDNKAEVIRYLRGRYPLITDDAVLRRANYGYYASESGYRPLADPTAMVATVDGLRQDFAEEAGAIQVPVTLIRGALSKIVLDEAFARTRELRPDFRTIELPEADHYIPEQRPDIIAEETARMLHGGMGRTTPHAT